MKRLTVVKNKSLVDYFFACEVQKTKYDRYHTYFEPAWVLYKDGKFNKIIDFDSFSYVFKNGE